MKHREGIKYMNPLRIIILIGITSIVTSALPWNVRADTVAVDVEIGYFGSIGRGPGVFGWQFSPRQDLIVTSVGVYDTPNRGGFWGDGLLEQHLIGIWDVSAPMTPVATALLPSGADTQLLNGARFISVEPFQLTAGHEYVIGTLFGDVDPDLGDFSANFFPMEVDPALEFIGRRSGGLQGNALVFPEFLEVGVAGDFGPNFLFVVPEPSASGMLLLGVLGLAAKMRKQTR
jgi:hypothetical protein